MAQVIGIGLPRTGSSSLSAALRILGYSGTSWCDLHHKGKIDDLTDGTYKQFFVDNSFFQQINSMLFSASNQFILTTRDADDWRTSIARYDYDCPDIEDYEAKVRLAIPEQQLLVISWDEGFRWQKLCTFLNQPVPNVDFPCINC